MKEIFLSEQIDRCRLKTNMDKIIWSNDFYSDKFSTIFLHFKKLIFNCICIDKKRLCPYIKSLIPELLTQLLVTALRVAQF